jgi:hypothetical protein
VLWFVITAAAAKQGQLAAHAVQGEQCHPLQEPGEEGLRGGTW